ncbi:hypothetical protein [Thomasclavelia ramosa]|uniref:hypothetical protein n=1 Tax=Thomasclavelia ramosa TaxID=1547 RepID=UPI0022E7A084|nr:hypothetical protein [Thomasclavelia ramosa]
MLKIEKIKEEILNFDMVNFGENLECYLSRITTNQNYDDTCYRIGIDCSECLRLSLLELLEEYKKPVKLSKFEYEYLKVAKKEGFNFIARDEDNRLYGTSEKPEKFNSTWFSSCDYVGMFKSTFSFVKWEDEEPWNIDNILANCEVMKDE